MSRPGTQDPRRTERAAGATADVMTRARAAEILDGLSGAPITVVGDVFLDEYLIGRADRLSREAPVPVLSFRRRFCRPGGAANPARNAAALGARVRQVAVVGDDAEGAELRRLMVEDGIDVSGVIVDASCRTGVKTRVVAEGLSAPQHVARMDRVVWSAGSAEVRSALAEAVRAEDRPGASILLSHYRGGVVAPDVVEAARGARAAQATRAIQGVGGVLGVDAQADLEMFRGFDAVRIGRADAAASLGRRLEDEDDFEAAVTAARYQLDAGVLTVGRGEAGSSLADAHGYAHVPAFDVQEVFDVAGAGDTVIALLVLALAAGARPIEAVTLAHAAASIVIGRLGGAAPEPSEILERIDAAKRAGPARS